MKSSGSRVVIWSVRATVKEFSSWPLVVGRVRPEPPAVSWPAVSPASAPSSAPALCVGAADSLVLGVSPLEQAVSVQSATTSARSSARMDLLLFILFHPSMWIELSIFSGTFTSRKNRGT